MEHNAALFVLCKQVAQYSVGVFCPHILRQLFDSLHVFLCRILVVELSKMGHSVFFLHLRVFRLIIDTEERKQD